MKISPWGGCFSEKCRYSWNRNPPRRSDNLSEEVTKELRLVLRIEHRQLSALASRYGAQVTSNEILCIHTSPLGRDSRSPPPAAGAAQDLTYDLVIRNGKIVDGTGNPWFRGDVAIKATRSSPSARFPPSRQARNRRQGADRRAGFIDMHSHSDFLLLEDGNAQSKIRQGVTTEVLGESTSAGPYQGKLPPTKFRRQGQADAKWTTLGGYFDTLEKAGVSVNVASYVGLDNIWQCVMGNSIPANAASNSSEMKELLEEAMKNGAIGLSCMLAMPPGSLATTDDIVELCKVVANA